MAQIQTKTWKLGIAVLFACISATLHKRHRVGRKYLGPIYKFFKFSTRIHISLLDKLKTSKFLGKNVSNSYSRGLKMIIWSLLLVRSRFYEAKIAIFSIDLSSTAHYYMIFENLFSKFPWNIFQGKDGNLAKLPEVVGH